MVHVGYANDGVIKLAKAYTGRPYVISFVNAYHGSTYGSLSMSAISLNMRKKYGPMLPGFYLKLIADMDNEP